MVHRTLAHAPAHTPELSTEQRVENTHQHTAHPLFESVPGISERSARPSVIVTVMAPHAHA
eukprot:2429920-Rhodomonas_salina.2